jgi:hypothetical protein
MMETMEVLGVDPEDEVEAEDTSPSSATDEQGNVHSNVEKTPYPTTTYSTSKVSYPAIAAGPHQPSAVATGDKGPKKKKGLTPEQKQKLEQMQQEQEAIRKERVANVSQRLLDKISVWTETDRSPAVTEAFQKKMQVAWEEKLSDM